MALTDAPSGRRAPAARRLPRPTQRRAPELLASCPQEGCTEGVLVAHGISIAHIVELVREGSLPRRHSTSARAARRWKSRRCASPRGGAKGFFRRTSRTVVCVGPLAFKFARSNLGARCNRFEADLYRRSNQGFYQTLLCPPLYCFSARCFPHHASGEPDDRS